MSRLTEELEPTEESHDDEHLTIRIPKPKPQTAMRSQWTSQRGKARCDFCRANNLKCDRIQPMCNYCSLTKQHDCTYAPTPNTSHRGIPRCDRCREHNLKCDRDIPSCSYCKEIGEASSCFYPSKLRPRPFDLQHSATPTPIDNDLRKWSQVPPDMRVYTNEDQPRQTYYRGTSSAGGSKSTLTSDVDSDPDSSHRGRFTAEYAQHRRTPPNYSIFRTPPSGSDVEYISHPSNPNPKIQIKSEHIEPWTHPGFISLPAFAFKELYEVDPVEIPRRQDFENALKAFHDSIVRPLQETSLFSISKYNNLARGLATGDMSLLSERVRTWAMVHKLSSGSNKYNIILVPRDSVFSMPQNLAEADTKHFMQDLLSGDTDLEKLQVHHYDRLPVQNQIYDILTYAHRYHYPAGSMLLEVVRLRFAYVTWPMAEMYVKMCPLCSIRAKPREKSHRSEERSEPGTAASSPTP